MYLCTYIRIYTYIYTYIYIYRTNSVGTDRYIQIVLAGCPRITPCTYSCYQYKYLCEYMCTCIFIYIYL